MDTIIRIISRTNLLIGRLAAQLTLVITVLVLVEVMARYFFNAPTSWSNEVNQYLLCALVMLGSGYTLQKYAHTRVDIIHARFSRKTQAVVEILTGVFILAATAPIIWFGALLTFEAIESGQTSVSAAQLLLWPSMLAVPLGSIFLALQAIANMMISLNFIFNRRISDEQAGYV